LCPLYLALVVASASFAQSIPAGSISR
jgi:hypothetical protein